MSKLIRLGLLLGLIGTTFAIKCYSCDSSKNAVCNVGLLSFTQDVVDCNDGGGILNFIPKSCMKLTARDKDNNEYVARGCSVNMGFNACDLVAKTIGFMSSQEGAQDFRCYQCDSDKCNGSVRIGGLTVLSILTACILFLF